MDEASGRRARRKSPPLGVVLLGAAAALGAVLTVAVLMALRAEPASPGAAAPPGPVIGFARMSRPAPAFDLPNLDGRGVVALRRYAGRPIVVNFWASSCDNCRQESPAIGQVARASRGRVAFLGVDTADLRGPAAAFARRYRLPFPSGFDPQGAVAGRYGAYGLPMTVFLSPSGTRILGVNLGALTARRLTAILRELYGRG